MSLLQTRLPEFPPPGKPQGLRTAGLGPIKQLIPWTFFKSSQVPRTRRAATAARRHGRKSKQFETRCALRFFWVVYYLKWDTKWEKSATLIKLAGGVPSLTVKLALKSGTSMSPLSHVQCSGRVPVSPPSLVRANIHTSVMSVHTRCLYARASAHHDRYSARRHTHTHNHMDMFDSHCAPQADAW